MSFMRNISSGTKSQLERGEVPDSESMSLLEAVTGSVVSPSRLQDAPVIVSETDEISSTSETAEHTAESVSQDAENKEPIDNGIEIVNLQLNTQTDDDRSDHAAFGNSASFAIPDGLAMDPMAPTALAVSTEFLDNIGSGLTLLRDHGKKIQKYLSISKKFDVLRRTWKSIANVVLVEAKDLPDGPDGGANVVYCKFKLGSETHKSKQVPKSKSTWRERFNLYVYDDNSLEVAVWHKGKQKNFMGRCTIDLSNLEKEKTHELWQELECGFGSLHLLLTLSGSSGAGAVPVDDVPTTHSAQHPAPNEDDFTWYRLDSSWTEVGQLTVTVHGAKGLSALSLSGKADAYCVLELDNSRVQTHTVRCTTEPQWSKSYYFCVNDVTSTLDVTVNDESMLSSLSDTLGTVSIPLLRINNGEKRWYALKDRSKKTGAKGNCPRILLQISIVWNPIKAAVRLLTPKETKYMQKPPKFDIPLIYSNLVFIKNVFDAISTANEHLKRLFEWENREMSIVALSAWLAFWFFFRLWMTPLLLLAPFLYSWTEYRSCKNSAVVHFCTSDDEISEEDLETHKDEKTIKMRLYGLQDLTFTIKNAIDYIVSLLERIRNLGNFTVPYLSYLVMVILVLASVALYLIPVNYLFMALGIYKFTRKFVNPERVPNNDLLDFLSRVPDNEIVKQWHELKVPEPSISRNGSTRRR